MGKYFKDTPQIRTSKYFKSEDANIRLAQGGLFLNLLQRAPQIFKGLTSGFRTVKDLAKFSPKVLSYFDDAAKAIAEPFKLIDDALKVEIQNLDNQIMAAQRAGNKAQEARLLLLRGNKVAQQTANETAANQKMAEELKKFNRADPLNLGGQVKNVGTFRDPKLVQTFENLGSGKMDLKRLETIKSRVLSPGSGASKFKQFQGAADALINPLKKHPGLKRMISSKFQAIDNTLPMTGTPPQPQTVNFTLEEILNNPSRLDDLNISATELSKFKTNYSDFLDTAESLEKGISLANPIIRTTGKIIAWTAGAAAAGKFFYFPKAGEGAAYLTDPKAAKEKTEQENKESKEYFGFDSEDFVPQTDKKSSETSNFNSQTDLNSQVANIKEIQNELKNAQSSGNQNLISFWESKMSNAINNLSANSTNNNLQDFQSKNYPSMSNIGNQPLVSGYYDDRPGGWEQRSPISPNLDEQRAYEELQRLRNMIVR
jgi:hypothetical protein